MEIVLEDEDPLVVIFDAIRSPLTKDRYERRLRLFFEYLKLEGTLKEQAREFVRTVKKTDGIAWATQSINSYMKTQRDRAEKKEIAEATLAGFWKPIKLFSEQNDILLNWAKIRRRVPKGSNYANDRAPTREEILRLLEYPDRRIKPAILMMVSGGFRVGSWDYLRWKHIEPLIDKKTGGIMAARLTVYGGCKEEYKTFISSEAYRAVKDWMDYRVTFGEKVTPDSWVLRDRWQTTGRSHNGLIMVPKQLKAIGLVRLIERALFAQGIRSGLEEGKRRYEFQTAHGFRKFAKSTYERHMKSLSAETLLGHDTGLHKNYDRLPESDLLADYLRAVPELTFLEAPPAADVEEVESLRAEIAKMQEDQRHKDEEQRQKDEKMIQLIEELRSDIKKEKHSSK